MQKKRQYLSSDRPGWNLITLKVSFLMFPGAIIFKYPKLTQMQSLYLLTLVNMSGATKIATIFEKREQ